jgi:hypothetical protein
MHTASTLVTIILRIHVSRFKNVEIRMKNLNIVIIIIIRYYKRKEEHTFYSSSSNRSKSLRVVARVATSFIESSVSSRREQNKNYTY